MRQKYSKCFPNASALLLLCVLSLPAFATNNDPAVIALDEGTGVAAETPNRVTILYDSFGKNPALTMDWGFAALVECGGKRILFDTGNSAQIFEHNVKAAGVDLRNLDFVVMSHRQVTIWADWPTC